MRKRKFIDGYPFITYSKETFSQEVVLQKSKAFYNWMNERRTVRDFSSKPVAKEVIENILLTASTAPSGAHKQPWTFCIVSNPLLKKQIRDAAEKEEYESCRKKLTDPSLRTYYEEGRKGLGECISCFCSWSAKCRGYLRQKLPSRTETMHARQECTTD